MNWEFSKIALKKKKDEFLRAAFPTTTANQYPPKWHSTRNCTDNGVEKNNGIDDGLAKRGSLQIDGIFVHESCPSFVYEKYLWMFVK